MLPSSTNQSYDSAALRRCFYFIELRMRRSESLYFTTADVALSIGDITYKPGAELSEIHSEALGAKEHDMSVLLHINLKSLNLLDAEINIMHNIHDEQVHLHRIYTGHVVRCVHRNDGASQLYLTSRFHLLERRIGIFFSALCRASFGDKKCQMLLADYSFQGQVIDCVADRIFRGSHQVEHEGFFNNGMVKFTSGNNINIAIKIVAERDGLITLFKAPEQSLLVGDDYIIIAGCDKSLKTCSKRFNNVINFRGEPFTDV